MKIITKAIENAFKKQGDTSNKSAKNIKIIMKLFNPCGSQTWYLYEKIDEDTYMCFANLGDRINAEIGTVSMSDLMSYRLPYGLKIERDKSFKPFSITLDELRTKIIGGGHV
jgi:hypothetical protein